MDLIQYIGISCVAFLAGFIDAVVGGGGLLQLPALMINLPNTALPTLFGTNKISALTGTSFSAYQFAKKISFDYKLLAVYGIVAGLSSFIGAKTVSYIDSGFLKPFILVILIAMFLYSYFKKDLGADNKKELAGTMLYVKGSLIGMVVGFYDGFFGPGAGSFYVLGFVLILGFDFLKASAYSKIINCVTNLAALFVFLSQGHYILVLAIVLAVFNSLGNIIGTRYALVKGNGFVRKVFLIVVGLMILRYGYDVVQSLM